jgi:putative hemolysin
MPDLAVNWVKIELEADEGCMEAGAELGTTVNVHNAGDDSAPPFALDVNGTLVDIPTGLAAGEQTFVWVPGYVSGTETRILVDSASEVEESDEENNVYAEFVPIPTPLPTCAPPPGTTPVLTETSEAESRAPGDFEVPAISVANAASLAPVRITARSDYSDGPTSFMQFEIDEQGNIRLAVDTPDGLEEWFVIDGVTYAGEASAEGLTPYQAVEDPQKVAGFVDPFDLFAPRGDTDRFVTTFPLQAVLWWGTPERTEHQGTEPIHGLNAEEYTIAVKPEGAPQEAYVGADRMEDLAAAVSAGEGASPVTLWAEPESGAILQAEWNLDLPTGTRAQYRLDVSPVGVGPFALPSADMPNPAAQYCAEQGYTTEIRTEDAGEVGYCVLSNGSACEEWAFYRGECTAETAVTLAEATPVSEAAQDVPQEGTADEAVAAVVTEYWTSVGSEKLKVAWEHLTDAYRQREYQDDYGLYKEDLLNPKLCSAEPTEITPLRGDADESVLYTSLAVERGRRCKKRTYEFEMRLVYDADKDAWLIADMTRLD